MKHQCPICRKPTDSEMDADFPFCSERCRLIDLGNWATEKYAVSEPVFEEDESADEPSDGRAGIAATIMNPTTDAAPAKPRFALAIATSLGLGYLPKAPGTLAR